MKNSSRKLSVLLLAAALLASLCILPAAADNESETENIDETEIHTDSPIQVITADGGHVKIKDAGVYRVSGTAERIVVDTDGAVVLILDGVSLRDDTCLNSKQDSPVLVVLADNSINTMIDGADAFDGSADPVISANGNLTFTGGGSLILSAAANTAVRSDGTLTVLGGDIDIQAANRCIKADNVKIAGGSVALSSYIYETDESAEETAEDEQIDDTESNVSASGEVTASTEPEPEIPSPDGIRAETVTVSGGTLTLACGDDGIQADTLVTVRGGEIILNDSGIRCDGDVVVSGGSITGTTIGDAISAGTMPETESEDVTADIIETDSSDASSEASAETFDEPAEPYGSVLISGGSIDVTCGDEGIQAVLAVDISRGSVTINADGNGITSAGTITMSGGSVDVTAALDGIQAVGDLTVSGGSVSLLTGTGGGGAINKAGENFGGGPGGPWGNNNTSTASEVSTKGLKSDANIYITGGTIDLSTEDDAIHCAVLCEIDGGDITVNAGDDGIHADDMIIINDGNINLTDCFEGIEAYAIEVNGGTVEVDSVNDGVNANGPEGGGWGFPGQNNTNSDFTSISGATITYYHQTGGTVNIVITGNNNNLGDGLDSNGAFTMDGGTLTVSTNGNTMENAIDSGDGNGLVVNGGMILAGGAGGMQEGPSSDSAACAAVISTGTQKAGTEITILDADGNEIWSATMTNPFSCLVIAHPELTVGNTYTVTYNDAETTLDFTDTNVISSSGFGGFGGFGGGPGGGFGGGPF